MGGPFELLAKGIQDTIKLGMGYSQYRKARKLLKKGEKLEKEAWAKRTDYKIPTEITGNVGLAESEAFGKPAIQKAMEESADIEMGRNLSTVRRYATSSADALALATGATQQARDGMNEAAVAGAQQRSDNMQHLYEAKNTLADYKTLQWDMNVNVPFLQRMQWAMDLQGAGYQGKIDSHNFQGS
jgi:hypothetical protein